MTGKEIVDRERFHTLPSGMMTVHAKSLAGAIDAALAAEGVMANHCERCNGLVLALTGGQTFIHPNPDCPGCPECAKKDAEIARLTAVLESLAGVRRE